LFCPSCQLEYRSGFTRCSDCDVDLVAALPTETTLQEVGVHDLRSPSILRRGVSVPDAAVIRDALNAAGIRFNTRRATAEIVADGTPTYEFWVDGEDRANAVSVLESAFEAVGEQEPLDSTDSAPVAPVSEVTDNSAEDNSADPAPDDLAGTEDAFEDDELTAEAWTGSAADQANVLTLCLREVGIASRIAKIPSGVRVLVDEKDIVRSKEIIREVIEGAPSE